MHNGLGPANITSLIFKFNGKDYKAIIEIYKYNFPEIFALVDHKKKSSKSVVGDFYLLGAKGVIECHEIYFSTKPTGIYSALSKIKLVIEYENIYGDKQDTFFSYLKKHSVVDRIRRREEKTKAKKK